VLGGAPAGQRRRQAAALLLTLPLQLVGLPCLRIDTITDKIRYYLSLTITLLAFPQTPPPPSGANSPAPPSAAKGGQHAGAVSCNVYILARDLQWGRALRNQL
jgi:hypothetical protein